MPAQVSDPLLSAHSTSFKPGISPGKATLMLSLPWTFLSLQLTSVQITGICFYLKCFQNKLIIGYSITMTTWQLVTKKQAVQGAGVSGAPK